MAGRTRGLLAAAAVAVALLIHLIAPGHVVAQSLPADEAGARAALDASSRHGEYVDIKVPNDSVTPLQVFVVYPERPDKAPVVILLHETFGLSDWMRNLADHLAANGFIAIAVKPKPDVRASIEAARVYGTKLPAANGKSAIVYYGTDAAALDSPVAVYGLGGRTIKDIQDTLPATMAFLRERTK